MLMKVKKFHHQEIYLKKLLKPRQNFVRKVVRTKVVRGVRDVRLLIKGHTRSQRSYAVWPLYIVRLLNGYNSQKNSDSAISKTLLAQRQKEREVKVRALSVCPSIRLPSIYLSVYLSVRLCVRLCVSVYLYICLPFCLAEWQFRCLTACLFL